MRMYFTSARADRILSVDNKIQFSRKGDTATNTPKNVETYGHVLMRSSAEGELQENCHQWGTDSSTATHSTSSR